MGIRRQTRMKHITLDETEKLFHWLYSLKTGYGLRNACLLWLSFHHGLRSSECLNLKWSNFSSNSGGDYDRIFIERAKGSLSGTHDLDEREKFVLSKLRAYYIKLNWYAGSGFLALPENSKSPYKAMSRNNWAYHLREESTLKFGSVRAKQITPHSLRHGCGVYMALKGIETQLIQQWLGHASISSTLIYTGINPQQSMVFEFT